MAPRAVVALAVVSNLAGLAAIVMINIAAAAAVPAAKPGPGCA